jgi:uncharacterized protein with PIN domain
MSGTVQIRFYEELNDFLPLERRKVAFHHQFTLPGSIKDMIEALGIPHTEVDLILVNGRSVDFNYTVQDGDRVSVYPVFESLDITPVTRLRPVPLRTIRFVLDTHLGRLAAYLRLFGFDTLYRNDYDDRTLADISADQRRILLTRDRQLLMRKQITHGYYVRATQPQKQLLEVLNRFDLRKTRQPFTRCMHCNGEINPVAKEEIAPRLLPRTRAGYNQFRQCAQCRKIYWKGSHYRRLQQLVEAVSDNGGSG